MLNLIDNHIKNHKALSDREKLQCFVWVHSNYKEGRFSDNDIKVLAEHLEQHADFFPSLLEELREINAIIKNKDSKALMQKLEDAIGIISTLSRLEKLMK